MKLSHESIIIELKTGAVIQGTVSGVENSMNMHMKNVKLTSNGRQEKSLETMTIRGSNIRFVILPEQLALDNLLIENFTKKKEGNNNRNKFNRNNKHSHISQNQRKKILKLSI